MVSKRPDFLMFPAWHNDSQRSTYIGNRTLSKEWHVGYDLRALLVAVHAGVAPHGPHSLGRGLRVIHCSAYASWHLVGLLVHGRRRTAGHRVAAGVGGCTAAPAALAIK